MNRTTQTTLPEVPDDIRRDTIRSLKQRRQLEAQRITLQDRLLILQGQLETGNMSGSWKDGDRVQNSGDGAASFVRVIEEIDDIKRRILRTDLTIDAQDRGIELLTGIERDVLRETIINGRTDLAVSMDWYIGETTVRRIRNRAINKVALTAFGLWPTLDVDKNGGNAAEKHNI